LGGRFFVRILYMITIKEIKDKNLWESFLSDCFPKTFLISWNWGEFQKKQGNKFWRFGVFKNDNLLGVALVIKIKAKRGTFLFVPHGPLVKNQNAKKEVLSVLLTELKKIARKEKCVFIRISPIWQKNLENIKIFRELGLRSAPIHMHPENTWQLDIRPSEKELLKGMRKTTRYLIKQGEKNQDIVIVKSKNQKDLETFYKIYQSTAKRHNFSPFSLKYIEDEFMSFLPDEQILLFLGKYKNEVVSGAVIVFWQKIGFYHHGASIPKYNKIPVSYLLQWEAIKEAKKRGCVLYNFWGIAPDIKEKKDIKKSSHPWKGLTLFKMGFSGFREDYVKTQDLPLFSLRYFLIYIFEKIRKWKRGL